MATARQGLMNSAVSQHVPLWCCLVLVFSRSAAPPPRPPHRREPPIQRRLRYTQLIGYFRPAQFIVCEQLSRFGQKLRFLKKTWAAPLRRSSSMFRRGDKATLRSHRSITQSEQLHSRAKCHQILRNRPQCNPSGLEFLNQSHQVRERLPNAGDGPYKECISTPQLLHAALQLRSSFNCPHAVHKNMLGAGLLKLPDLHFTIAIDGGDPGIPECPGRTS